MEKEKPTVLIVDDEESIRSILSRKLEFDGYHCEVAADGREALHKASMKSYDLVLLDINMPGLSGIEVLRRLTADYPDTCVIMITAIADTEIYIEALRLGAYDYVTKPFDLDDVSARVKKALEIRRLIMKKGGHQLSPEQNAAIRSLICGQISFEEFKGTDWTQDEESTPGTEFAIPYFGSATPTRELVSYLQIAQKLLLVGEVFLASIGSDGERVSMLGGEIADQLGGYANTLEMINRLNIAAIPSVSGRLHIPDRSLVKSIPLAQGEEDGISGRLTSPDITVPQLEPLIDTMLIVRAPNKRQREARYHSNTSYRYPSQSQPDNNEILEAVMKLSWGQEDFCTVDSFLQTLGQQMILP